MGDEDSKHYTPRFRFPPGSQVGMYNKPVLRRLGEGDELWITEGPSDCWAMLSAGRKAVAIPSATSLTMDDIRLLTHGLPDGVSLHMAPDNDRPGMELFQDLKRHFPQMQGHVLPEGVKDFGECLGVVFQNEFLEPLYFGNGVLDKLLSTKSRIDAHQEHHV